MYVCMYVERDSLAAGGPRGADCRGGECESQKPTIDSRDGAQGIHTTTFTQYNAIAFSHSYFHFMIGFHTLYIHTYILHTIPYHTIYTYMQYKVTHIHIYCLNMFFM